MKSHTEFEVVDLSRFQFFSYPNCICICRHLQRRENFGLSLMVRFRDGRQAGLYYLFKK